MWSLYMNWGINCEGNTLLWKVGGELHLIYITSYRNYLFFPPPKRVFRTLKWWSLQTFCGHLRVIMHLVFKKKTQMNKKPWPLKFPLVVLANNTVLLACWRTTVHVYTLPFCLQFCHNNKKAQKYLLGGFECLVKLHQTQLLPRVPIILKDLYDGDLVEEDVILAWAEKVKSWHTI